jgi:hypothetical protein
MHVAWQMKARSMVCPFEGIRSPGATLSTKKQTIDAAVLGL